MSTDLQAADDLLRPLLAELSALEEAGQEPPALPTEKPPAVALPVQDAAVAGMLAQVLRRIDLEIDEIKDAAKLHVQRRERLRLLVLHRIGAYERPRADGKGTQTHLGSLQDWANEHRAPGTKRAETPFGDLCFRSAIAGVDVDDLAALERWCFENGQDFVKVEKRAKLKEIMEWIQSTGEIPGGCKYLEPGRYQTFSVQKPKEKP